MFPFGGPVRQRIGRKKCEVNMRCLFLAGFALFTAGYYFMDAFFGLKTYEEQQLSRPDSSRKVCRILSFTSDEHDVIPLRSGMIQDKCGSHLDITSFMKDGDNCLKRVLVPNLLIPMFWSESLRVIKCKYHAVERQSDYANRHLYTRRFNLMKEYIIIDPIADIIRAKCSFNRTTIYNGVHFFVRSPDEGKRSSLGLPPLRSASDLRSLSVLIVGLDSISHPHFARSMPKTASFLRSLPHVELRGFNRLGNSFESLMPLLSGLSGLEMANFFSSHETLDAWPFIWKEFRKAGYETALGEDNIEWSVFPGQGFDEPPTDHYLRPALLEMWLRTRRDVSYSIHCNEKNNYAEVLREFFYRLIPHHQRHRFFTFLWWTQGINHLFNSGRALDTLFLEMFQHAALSGLLKNTLLLVVSNHGLINGSFYHTVPGRVEGNLPLALLCYPKWMEQRFPQAISNLRMNEARLVTAYDLHATLQDLHNLTSIKDSSVAQRSFGLAAQDPPRGISLFLPVPSSRDCSSAQVPTKYCLCSKQTQASTKEGYVVRAAILIVRTINRVLQKHIPPCEKLSLKLVLAVDEWRRPTIEYSSEIRVRLLATPGEGQFEGVVKFSAHKVTLSGPIERTNAYGNDSYCIDNYLINMYCYCPQMSEVPTT